MFKEILQIIPKLSPGDLNQMERSLSTRFGKVAKKFGKGLVGALTGGGIAGIALGLIDKLLNPLKETQEAIDRVLRQGDDIVTNAKQFGTTAGKLFRLQQLAKSTGLDAGSLDVLLQKFQAALAEAKQDPNKATAVRQFVAPLVIDPETGRPAARQPEQDIAETFFHFIQALQKLDKSQQVIVQQEVFGEKQILKMADFLQTDFDQQSRKLGGPRAANLTESLEKLGDLNDLKDTLEARREMEDTLKKSRAINEGMVRAQDAQLKLELQKENQRVANYQNLMALTAATTQIQGLIEQGVGAIGGLVVKLTDLSSNVKKIAESRLIKGLVKTIGGD